MPGWSLISFSSTFVQPSIERVTVVSFKLKSIGVGGSMLSICKEFLLYRRQRVVVDSAASEWIPIISGMPQGSVVGPLLFIQYTREMFEPVENRLFAYTDDSTLLAVVRKPTDRPAVAASLNRDLARIQEWCNHWCMILNPNKTKALVVSRYRTVSPPHGDLFLSGVSIRASQNLDILGMKLESKLTFGDHVRGIVSRFSQRIGILCVLSQWLLCLRTLFGGLCSAPMRTIIMDLIGIF